MSGRDEGYYGPSAADLGKGCLLPAFCIVGVILVAALCVMSFHEADSPADAAAVSKADAGASEDDAKRTDIAIDVTDAWAMHDAGLPTKADILSWHMYGRWGFARMEDGVHTVHIWEDLPGEAWVWDVLYGLDNANPAFKFR